jgi:hypothetical protein
MVIGASKFEFSLDVGPIRLSLPMNFTHLLVKFIGGPEEARASGGLRAGFGIWSFKSRYCAIFPLPAILIHGNRAF